MKGLIGDFFTVKGGKRLPKGENFSIDKTNHPYLRVVDFKRNSLKKSGIKYISDEVHSKISRYTIESSDVYISIAGTIGVAGIIPDELNGSNLTENAAKVAPKAGVKIIPKYLSYFLNCPSTQSIIKSKTMAVGVPKLALFRIQEIPIFIPPLPVQERIAAILDAADALRQKDQALLKKYDDLTQSLFLDMFGDPVSNPKGWEKSQAKNLIEKIGKISKSHSTDRIEYVDISSIDNKRNFINGSTSYELNDRPSRAQQILKNGDILLSTVRPNLKNIAMVNNDDLIGSTGFFVFRTKNQSLDNRFLFELLKCNSTTEYFTGITSGANYPALSSKDLQTFQVILPDFELQKQFAEGINAIEKQKEQVQTNIKKSEDLFQSLLQRAFKGELVSEENLIPN